MRIPRSMMMMIMMMKNSWRKNHQNTRLGFLKQIFQSQFILAVFKRYFGIRDFINLNLIFTEKIQRN